MKKVFLLVAIFAMAIGFATETKAFPSELLTVENLDNKPENPKRIAVKKNHKKRVKAKKIAQKKQLKGMKKVAKADGKVTPREKAIIKSEKEKIKRNFR